MWKHIEQLQSLSFPEWIILLTSASLLPAVAFSLRYFGLARTQTLLTWCAPPPIPPGSDLGEKDKRTANELAKLVSISARHGLYKANCLKQVLVLQLFLNRKGIHSTFHMGIKKGTGKTLNAHSWLECTGSPLIDSPNSLLNYTTIHTCNTQRREDKH